jgi:cytidylate kinase
MNHRIITIDGPAGAGKSTVSKALARALGCVYVDTGALYRGVAWKIQDQGLDWKDEAALASLLARLDLNMLLDQGQICLMCGKKDITALIRTPEISMLASRTSALPRVRAALLDIQHQIARDRDAVFEGRDMGTVVFPDAAYKFFLYADLAVRAQRRFDEMPGAGKDIDAVAREIQVRDTNDSKRKEAPLKPAWDAVKIDSSRLSVSGVVEKMLKIIQKP